MNGVDSPTYPTFRDGSLANLLIDQVREENPTDAAPVATS